MSSLALKPAMKQVKDKFQSQKGKLNKNTFALIYPLPSPLLRYTNDSPLCLSVYEREIAKYGESDSVTQIQKMCILYINIDKFSDIQNL